MATTEDSKKDETVPDQHKPPEIEKLGIEIGVESNIAFATPYRPASNGTAKNVDEELQELLHDQSEEWGPTVRQLVTMRRMDGQARALYRLLTLPIRAALSTSTFVPAEGGEAEAEFIDLAFNTSPEQGGMSVTFHRFMGQMLQGLFDGFCAFEKVIWQPEFGPMKGKYTLKKLAHRPADTITFIVDKQGGFAGLRQRAYNGGKVTDVFIEPEYAFYYAAQEEERKFYGVSFFQSAFYHYDKKVKLSYTAHLAAQRAAVGTRIGTVPLNASMAAKREFAAALGNLALAQYMMVPEGFKVELLKEGGSFDFLSLINHHASAMSKSILAGFFDKEQGAGKAEGSLVNFAQPGDEMFILMLRAIMDDIANQINHYIIPQLIDYNFDGGKYPVFTWGTLTDEQKEAISVTFDKLASAGQSMNVTPEFMRALEVQQAEAMGLDIDYDAVDARMEEEKAAAEEQMAAAQGIGPDGQPIAPAGNPEDAEIDDFEKQALDLTYSDEPNPEAYKDLMKLAGDLLERVGQ